MKRQDTVTRAVDALQQEQIQRANDTREARRAYWFWTLSRAGRLSPLAWWAAVREKARGRLRKARTAKSQKRKRSPP